MNHSTVNNITPANFTRSANAPTTSAQVMQANAPWNTKNASSGMYTPLVKVAPIDAAVRPLASTRSVPPMNALPSVNAKLYPDREALFGALSETYRQAMKAFYDAGCRYLQFDDTAWAYLCSDAELEKAAARVLSAAKDGADLVCLQELFASPYFCQSHLSSFETAAA